MISNKNKMADLPDPCAQPLSCYILVTSFYNPCRHNNNNAAESEEANPSGIEEVNSLATSVCESMFIAIYTTQKIQLNMQETGAGSGSIKHIVV